MIPVSLIRRLKILVILHLLLHDRIVHRRTCMLLNILFTDIIQQSIRHNGRRPRDSFPGHLLRVIKRHKCSMFYGIKSGVNAHLDPRIGSRMHSAFDSPSMTFIHRRVELFLGQLRRMGPVRR